MRELSLLLIKPNATRKKHTGEIIAIVEQAGYDIIKLKSFFFNRRSVNNFYAEHKGKEFFDRLTSFMLSGMIVALLVEKDNAVTDLRELIGATDPAKRRKGTIRDLYADDYTENAVHASDTHDHAVREISLIFPEV